MATSKPKYRVLVGLNYPPDNKRAEVGDVVTDLPDFAIRTLLRDGAIEEVKPKGEKKTERDPEVVVVEHVSANTEEGVTVKEEKVER